MAKKNNIESKGFSKAIEDLQTQPHKKIIERIESKTFPLATNNVFNYKPGYLAVTEFKSSLELLERRSGGPADPFVINMRVMNLFQLIAQKEQAHTNSLQDLAINTIKELYNVPDHINLKAFLDTDISLDTSQDISSELTPQQKDAMFEEIQKRIILNGLVHGSSMHIWKSVYYLVKDKLDNIDVSLTPLYDELTSSVNLAFWLMDPDMIQDMIESNSQVTQGFNKIEFDQPGKPQATIICKGINFPTLLHEVNKGVIDYLCCHGIPKDYTEEQLKYYYSVADNYSHEFWHYLLSPTLWSDLLDTANIDSKDIPGVIMKLSKLNYVTLTEIFRCIIDDKKQAKIKLKVWKII